MGTAPVECVEVAAWLVCQEDHASESDDALLAWMEVDVALTRESSLTASDTHIHIR